MQSVDGPNSKTRGLLIKAKELQIFFKLCLHICRDNGELVINRQLLE